MECSKRRYASKKAAIAAIAAIAPKRDGKKERRTYRCPDCNGWHLSSWNWSARDIRNALRRRNP